MSAYEDARLVIQQAMFGVQSGTWLSHKVSKDVFDAVLAALPPSIVVDGKVVELDDPELLDEIRTEFGDHGVAAAKWLTQAVLARGEER